MYINYCNGFFVVEQCQFDEKCQALTIYDIMIFRGGAYCG